METNINDEGGGFPSNYVTPLVAEGLYKLWQMNLDVNKRSGVKSE